LGKGWELGRPLYPSDIFAVCQQIPGVRYLSAVKLYGLRKFDTEWFCADIPELEICKLIIKPLFMFIWKEQARRSRFIVGMERGMVCAVSLHSYQMVSHIVAEGSVISCPANYL
jgi:hypothetical protein